MKASLTTASLSRRRFLAGTAALCGGSLVPLLRATPAAAADVALRFAGWNYDNDFVNTSIRSSASLTSRLPGCAQASPPTPPPSTTRS